MRANIYEFLATGFEEIEALTPVTVMRQGGQNFKLVSMTGNEYVETANRAWVKADMLFEASDFRLVKRPPCHLLAIARAFS